MDYDEKKLKARAERLAIGRYRCHVLMCRGPDCCSAKTGRAAWKVLKRALRGHGLDRGAVLRSKVSCLGVCRDGPVAVVYPDGTWYAGLTADCVPRFVHEHLLGRCPVKEWVFVENPLTPS